LAALYAWLCKLAGLGPGSDDLGEVSDKLAD
jgi:hypothetical protein